MSCRTVFFREKFMQFSIFQTLLWVYEPYKSEISFDDIGFLCIVDRKLRILTFGIERFSIPRFKSYTPTRNFLCRRFLFCSSKKFMFFLVKRELFATTERQFLKNMKNKGKSSSPQGGGAWY